MEDLPAALETVSKRMQPRPSSVAVCARLDDAPVVGTSRGICQVMEHPVFVRRDAAMEEGVPCGL